MTTLLVQEGELHIDLSKEMKNLFSFQKYILQENTILGPVKLSLIEENHSIISVYLTHHCIRHTESDPQSA